MGFYSGGIRYDKMEWQADWCHCPYHEVPFGIIYDAVDGFTGLRIFLGINFYIGTAYHVAISQGGKK
jgi:hypothetical protein